MPCLVSDQPAKGVSLPAFSERQPRPSMLGDHLQSLAVSVAVTITVVVAVRIAFKRTKQIAKQVEKSVGKK